MPRSRHTPVGPPAGVIRDYNVADTSQPNGEQGHTFVAGGHDEFSLYLTDSLSWASPSPWRPNPPRTTFTATWTSRRRSPAASARTSRPVPAWTRRCSRTSTRPASRTASAVPARAAATAAMVVTAAVLPAGTPVVVGAAPGRRVRPLRSSRGSVRAGGPRRGQATGDGADDGQGQAHRDNGAAPEGGSQTGEERSHRTETPGGG